MVKEATGGRGADVIYDPVGGETFTKSTKCIAFEGRIVVIGFASGDIASALDITRAGQELLGRRAALGPLQEDGPGIDPGRARRSVSALAEPGVAVPLVSARMPFERGAAGIAALACRRHDRSGGGGAVVTVTAWARSRRAARLPRRTPPGVRRRRAVRRGHCGWKIKPDLCRTRTPATDSWVLRRPPLGHVLATAHDMAREYRVMSALGPTTVPVPETHFFCADPEVIGAPFYVMQHVAGTVYRSTRETGAAVAGAGRVGIAYTLIDVLADLHDVDPASVGLGGFRSPRGLPDSAAQALAHAARRLPQPGAARHRRAVRGRSPPTCPVSGPPAIVHGDYRLDNVHRRRRRPGRGRARLGDGDARRSARRPRAVPRLLGRACRTCRPGR